MLKKITSLFFAMLVLCSFTVSNAANKDDPDYASGKSHGKEIGEIESVEKATADYNIGNSSDWRKAMDTEYSTIKRFGLDEEDSDYKDGFWDGYMEGFEDEYKDAYRSLRLEQIKNKINNEEDEADSPYSEFTTVNMFGTTINSSDALVKMAVESGTMFLSNKMKIQKEDNDFAVIDSKRYIKVSDVYSVLTDKNIAIYKNIPLSIKYAGPDAGGIYRLNNGAWEYMESQVSEDAITTLVKGDTYVGGKYVILIDRQTMISDTGEHWAREEIDYCLKNSIISGYEDGTYKPENNFTRAEMVVLLERIMDWGTGEATDLYAYDDGALVQGWSQPAFKKAIEAGVISGYDDNTLRPNKSISYQEVEWVMQRVAADSSFKWNNVADKILSDKGLLSTSFENINTKIKRGEVAYLIYLYKNREL